MVKIKLEDMIKLAQKVKLWSYKEDKNDVYYRDMADESYYSHTRTRREFQGTLEDIKIILIEHDCTYPHGKPAKYSYDIELELREEEEYLDSFTSEPSTKRYGEGVGDLFKRVYENHLEKIKRKKEKKETQLLNKITRLINS